LGMASTLSSRGQPAGMDRLRACVGVCG
jgi:hypothetical protein